MRDRSSTLTTNTTDEGGLYGADVSGAITSDGGWNQGQGSAGTADGGDNPYAWQSQVDLGTLLKAPITGVVWPVFS